MGRLDIVCNKPPKLKGKILSDLNWHNLSSHAHCSDPDNYDPCPNRRKPPHIPSTTTTATTTKTVLATFAITSNEEKFPELSEERPKSNNVSKIWKNDKLIYLLVTLGGVLAIVIIVGVIFCGIYRHRLYSKKNALRSSKPILVPNSDFRPNQQIVDVETNEEINTLSLIHSRKSSECILVNPVISDESNSKSMSRTQPKHVIGTTLASSFGNVSTHYYDSLNFSISNSSVLQNKPVQPLQQTINSTPSSAAFSHNETQATIQIKIVPSYLNCTPNI